MKRLFKGLLSVVVALAMVIGVLPVQEVSASSSTIASSDFLATKDASGKITLTNDVVLTDKLVIDSGTTIDLNGNDLTLANISDNYAVIVKSDLTITGTGTVEVTGLYGFGIPNDNTPILTIDGGTYVGQGPDYTYYIIGAYNGSVVINNGTFKDAYCAVNAFADSVKVTINDGIFEDSLDINYTLAGIGNNFTVNGGTFKGEFNPEYTINSGEVVYYNSVVPGKVVDPTTGKIVEVNMNSIKTESELRSAVALGGDITLADNIELTTGLVVAADKNVVLNLGGYTISTEDEYWDSISVFEVLGSLEIKGEGTIDSSNSSSTYTNYSMAVWARNGGDVVINGGTFTNENGKPGTSESPINNELIYGSDTIDDGNNSSITINDGVFKGQNFITTGKPTYLVNARDDHYREKRIDINVFGGKFYNYDPSNSNSENPIADLVPEGYNSKLTGETYVVSKINAVKETETTELEDAKNNNTELTVTLGSTETNTSNQLELDSDVISSILAKVQTEITNNPGAEPQVVFVVENIEDKYEDVLAEEQVTVIEQIGGLQKLQLLLKLKSTFVILK